MRSGLVLAALSMLLAAGLGAAQGHDHSAPSGPVVLAHDAPVDGRTFVGNLNHFVAIARGDDEVPDFHQDLPMRVLLNGAVVAQTTTSSGHDYDGVNTLDVAFFEPGNYVVEALGADGSVVASFGGEVVPLDEQGNVYEVQLEVRSQILELTGSAAARDTVEFTFGVQTSLSVNSPVPHSDCLFEDLLDGVLQFRTKTHTHEEWQVVDYAFQEPGDHVVRVTCYQAYPSASATLFAPLVREEQISVLPGPPVYSFPVPEVPVQPPAALNAVVLGTGSSDTYTLVGTFDPYTVVGAGSLQHLNALVVDPATGRPVQHVDFTAVLYGPTSFEYRSETLHEYDGILEMAVRQQLPGPYTYRVTADAGDWSGTLDMAYLVAPPAVPTSLGEPAYTFQGAPTPAGALGDYELASTTLAGPFAHSEIEVRVVPVGSAVPVFMTKLHTHDDGTFPFQLALPAAGEYTLHADGFPLMPEAVLQAPGQEFQLTATPGPGFPAADPAVSNGDGESAATPSVAPGVLLAFLVAVALLRRRT